MSYSTQQDILDFVEDNNVKFVRFITVSTAPGISLPD